MIKRKELKWDDVTIGQYLKMQDIISSKDIIEENKVLEIIPLFYPIDVQDEPMGNVLLLMKDVVSLLNQDIKPCKLAKKYRVGKWDAKISAVENMTISQFFDYQAITSKSSDANLIDLMSTILVPVGAKYNDNTYDIEDFKSGIEELPITLVPSILENFRMLLKKSLRRSLASSTAEIVMMKGLDWKTKMSLIKSQLKMMDLVIGLNS